MQNQRWVQPLFSVRKFSPLFGSPSSKISSAKVHFAPPFCENSWSFGKKTVWFVGFLLAWFATREPQRHVLSYVTKNQEVSYHDQPNPWRPRMSPSLHERSRKKGLLSPHNCKPLRSHYFQKWYVTRINSKAISIQYSVSKVFFETAHGSEIKMTSWGFRQVFLCTFQVMQDLFHQQYGQDALNPDWMESRWHHYLHHYLTTPVLEIVRNNFNCFLLSHLDS